MTYALWIVQVLLALVFLFAGGVKLVTPVEEMLAQMPVPLPGWFLQFIGVAEVVGALGLLLPGITHIRPGLTPLAAAGLTIIMIGAVALTVPTMGFVMAILPLVVGIFTAFVAYGRWRIAPLRGSTRRPGLQPAS
ncbi:MAG TPA: DoxX family protein [Chloroflexota bacterium]